MEPYKNDSVLFLFGHESIKNKQDRIILSGFGVDSVAKGQLVFVNSHKGSASLIAPSSIRLLDVITFINARAVYLKKRTTICFVPVQYLGFLPHIILGEIPWLDIRTADFGGHTYNIVFYPKDRSYEISFDR